MIDEDQTIAEVELWVQMLEQAADIHAGLPDAMRDRVDGQAMEAELMALTVYLASMSTRTRQSFMRTCRDSLVRLRATRLNGPDADVVDFPQRQAL